MNIISPAIHNMSRRLVAMEESQARASHINAVVLVCEKLRVDLTKLAGPAGFASLLSRALAMARAQTPTLKDVKVRTDGTLEGLDVPSRNGDEGETLLVAQFLALLVTFIGEALTSRVVHDIWPQIPADTTDLKDEERS